MTKKEENKTKIPWWIWVLLVLLILSAIFSSNYEECVEDCVHDLDLCSDDADFYSGTTCEECSYDLESCIRWCD